MKEKIFKAYDVRGIYPEEINEEAAFKIGAALIKFLNKKTVVVGYDMRSSSDKLFTALASGINSMGAKVIDIGLCSTDMVYFAVASYKYDAGIMITASHNPKQYNGMKFVRENAIPIGEESGLKEIKEFVMNDQDIHQKYENIRDPPDITKKQVLEDFKKHVLSFIDKDKIAPIKILADAGNGMAGLTVPEIFKGLNCEVIPMCFELDGNFPDHQPDPLVPENRIKIESRMKKGEADLGIAFDGDADRCFFIDDTGNFVPGDFITALLAEHFLKSAGEGKIIYDVRASWAVRDIVKKNNGTPLLNRVGHAFFKQRMRDEKAIFGGEVSGHYYFKDNFNADTGIVAAVLLIEILSKSNKKLSELVAKFKDYHVSGEINSTVEDKDAAIEKLKLKYNDGNLFFIDGISVEYDDWHFNVRKSNTEPLLRLNLEAKSEKVMNEKIDEVLAIIRS
jgi:phosphomannomutase